ncbi:DUF202 domain-containing protein [Rhodococcus sp. USK10]|uniref:DUF202 domain-containing protein n=1 Tax=Rhodococcus sp. USK10 TaxID=2789739 RepID=UPI001C5F6599|nr:DUF202 domain-containing protein [Rhodococcus sp. USK10]QYB06935.1 DUF202 domain-containing protein [Rhodococcus sp. USK10]
MTYDPGLQPQRTALAWQRTGLSVLAASAAIGFAAYRLDAPLLAVGALVNSLVVGYLGIRHFPKGSARACSADDTWPTLLRTASVVAFTAVLGAGVSVAGMLHT